MKGLVAVLALLVPSAKASGQHEVDHHPSREEEHHTHVMEGFYGPYDAGREGSGTSWLPASTPMESYHFQAGAWAFMQREPNREATSSDMAKHVRFISAP